MSDTSDLGGGGGLCQWQLIIQETMSAIVASYHTQVVHIDGPLKHENPYSEFVPVPLGHWILTWNSKSDSTGADFSTISMSYWTGCRYHRLNIGV